MDWNTFHILVERLPGLARKNTHFRQAIPLDKRVTVALYTLESSAEDWITFSCSKYSQVESDLPDGPTFNSFFLQKNDYL